MHDLITARWIEGHPPPDLPVTQVYGFCFTPGGRLVLLRDGTEYNLPGGKPETGETWLQTLCREAREELQIEVDDVIPFGHRLIEHDQNVTAGRPYAQLRAVARVVRYLPRAVDPATGRVHERLAFWPTVAMRRLNWPDDGAAQLAAAVRVWQSRVSRLPNRST